MLTESMILAFPDRYCFLLSEEVRLSISSWKLWRLFWTWVEKFPRKIMIGLTKPFYSNRIQVEKRLKETHVEKSQKITTIYKLLGPFEMTLTKKSFVFDEFVYFLDFPGKFRVFTGFVFDEFSVIRMWKLVKWKFWVFRENSSKMGTAVISLLMNFIWFEPASSRQLPHRGWVEIDFNFLSGLRRRWVWLFLVLVSDQKKSVWFTKLDIETEDKTIARISKQVAYFLYFKNEITKSMNK